MGLDPGVYAALSTQGYLVKQNGSRFLSQQSTTNDADFRYVIKAGISSKAGASSENGNRVVVNEDRVWIKENRGRLSSSVRERPNGNKKIRHNDKITAILGALQSFSDVDSAMETWKGKLQPREEAIILKEQRDLRVAMSLFFWFRNQPNHVPNVFRYNILFRILGRHKKWDLLTEMWHRMLQDNLHPTNVTYSTIIDAYTKAGLTEEAISWFTDMSKQNVQPDEVTLNTMVNLYKSARRLVEAEAFSKKFIFGMKISETADSAQPLTVDSYNTLIDLYGKLGRLSDASHTFEEMVSRGIQPDTVSFNTMIHICGNNNRLDEAEALLKKMIDMGCEPNVDTFNILIALHIKHGDLQSARDSFISMKKSNALPNEVTYRTLLHGYCSNHLVSDAEELVREIESTDYTLSGASLVRLIQMYIQVGELAKANEQFQMLKLSSCLNSDHIFPLIDTYAERGFFNEAERVFLSCIEVGIVKTTVLYNAMIKAYGLGKMYSKALNLFKSMDEEGLVPDEATLNTMIHVTSVSGDVEKAVTLLSKMHQEGFSPRLSSYTAIIMAYSKAHKVEEAKDVFEDLKRVHRKVDEVAYGAMVNVYAEAGLVKEAEAALQTMESAGHTVNTIVLVTMMKLYRKYDMVQSAEEMFRKIQSLDELPKVPVWNILLDIYGRCGMTEQAWFFFRKMQKEGNLNKNSCRLIVNVLMRSGRDEEALSVAEKMQESSMISDVPSFNFIIALYASIGKQHDALEQFRQMVKRGFLPNTRTYSCMKDVIENPGLLKEAVFELLLARKEENKDNIHRLTAVASIYTLAGLHEKGMEACVLMQESGVDLDVTAYNAMVYAYGMNGHFDEAVRLFIDMQSKGPKPNSVTFTTMILLYGKAGLVEGVSRLFNRMKQAECTPDDATFKAMIAIYTEAGRFDLVSMVTNEMRFVQFLKEKSSSMSSIAESDEEIEDI